MLDTVEELETNLEDALLKIENIAALVLEKKLDTYEGFMKSEKYKNEIIEIGNKLKKLGIDITTRVS
ncbi:MAG: hypothetical protein COB17_05400 [Sulfurimonas sp.]|nr:MAG: hypothetical protein COB17_05400 [Sulfurimonas sp.]